MMQQMMQGQTQQLLQNPQLMSQMMQNPAIQQTMDSLLRDPQVLEQMMASNPMFGGNRDMVSSSGLPGGMGEGNPYQRSGAGCMGGGVLSAE
jgi:hypothetical protein